MIIVQSRFLPHKRFCFEEDGGILVNDQRSHRPPADIQQPYMSYKFGSSQPWCVYLTDEAHHMIKGRYCLHDGNFNSSPNWMSPKIAYIQNWTFEFEDIYDAALFKLAWL